MEIFNPDSWMDVAAIGILSIPSVIAAGVSIHGHKSARLRSKRQKETSEELLYEITNDHESNIRHDIDDIAETVRQGFREVTKDLRCLREELNTERVDRIEGDRRR